MDRRKHEIVSALQQLLKPKAIFERSDADTRQREGLAPAEGILAGDAPADRVLITENGHRFGVDVRRGQKTGFFLDQRENRERVGQMSAGRRVLNTFCYTGGFSVYAAKGGAKQVISVDVSREALEQGCDNYSENGLEVREGEWVKADVFDYLRQSAGEYDLIVLDPPAFCKRREDVPDACRGYKDINLQAFRKCAPGAIVHTYSCSSHMTTDLFRKVVFGAAKDSGRQVRVIAETANPADHPVSLYHPEGSYLKGLVLHVSSCRGPRSARQDTKNPLVRERAGFLVFQSAGIRRRQGRSGPRLFPSGSRIWAGHCGRSERSRSCGPRRYPKSPCRTPSVCGRAKASLFR